MGIWHYALGQNIIAAEGRIEGDYCPYDDQETERISDRNQRPAPKDLLL